MNEEASVIYQIIQNEDIYTVFQPIVSLKDGSIIGYESLSRGPSDTEYASPVALIEQALKENRLWDLETLFRKNAINQASQQKINKLLFINVEPNAISDPTYKNGFTKEYISEMGLSPEHIVIEITERSAIKNFEMFNSALQHYKEQGYIIAIDDTGAGYSNFSALSKINPYFIKIDMEFIRDVDKDSYKQAIISSFVNLSLLTNSRLIAEGIETEGELKTLVRLGVHAAQGYFISRPSRNLNEVPSYVKGLIILYNNTSLSSYSLATNQIGEISSPVPPFDASVSCIELKNFFQQTEHEGVCLLINGFVSGLMMKNHLDSILSSQYGFSLYSNKSAGKIMDYQCLIVNYDTPLNIVAELALNRSNHKIYDNIIVTKNFQYYGMVTMIELLKKSLEIEKNRALEMNPLTGLPGNIPINKALNEKIENGSVSVLYIDLDNFKTYNDVYGFEKGDEIIKMTRDVIINSLSGIPNSSFFVGHIGGDDFVLLLDCNRETCEKICQGIITNFDERVRCFFNETDWNKKCMIGKDRKNNYQEFPLTAISIGALCGRLYKFKTPDNLAQFMSAIKQKAKLVSYSSYFIEDISDEHNPNELSKD